MVTANGWSGIEPLRELPKLAESNLLYTFHCYDPFFFTHQGASWVGDPPRELKSMPFPSSPDAVASALAASPAKDADAIRWYGSQKFDAGYLRDRLAKGMEYGSINRVPVILGEFGAYPPVSPVDSRTRWFEAMATVVRDIHVPNALWGYDDALGLGREVGSDGKLKLDPVTLKALYGVSP
jgi:endoglucanase